MNGYAVIILARFTVEYLEGFLAMYAESLT